MLAKQAATSPIDNAEMLEFSVAIEKNDEGMIMLTILSVLLEEYTPQNRNTDLPTKKSSRLVSTTSIAYHSMITFHASIGHSFLLKWKWFYWYLDDRRRRHWRVWMDLKSFLWHILPGNKGIEYLQLSSLTNLMSDERWSLLFRPLWTHPRIHTVNLFSGEIERSLSAKSKASRMHEVL
jgi:hypothetical protein